MDTFRCRAGFSFSLVSNFDLLFKDFLRATKESQKHRYQNSPRLARVILNARSDVVPSSSFIELIKLIINSLLELITLSATIIKTAQVFHLNKLNFYL